MMLSRVGLKRPRTMIGLIMFALPEKFVVISHRLFGMIPRKSGVVVPVAPAKVSFILVTMILPGIGLVNDL